VKKACSWINVDDKLPEYNQSCEFIMYYFGERVRSKGYYASGFYETCKDQELWAKRVSHWRPLEELKYEKTPQ
jgi:hypothetical protein